MTRKVKRHDTPADDAALQPVRATPSPEPDISFLLSDLCDLIRAAKGRAATAINVELVLLYWHIGDRIGRDILKEERAPYGKRILSTLSKELIAEYGPGYSQPNLTRMIRFAALFPSEEIVSTVSKELSWSHFVELLQIEDAVAREFYVQMCRIERWSVRELHSKIQGMLFERTALSRKPEDLARQELAMLQENGRVTPDLVFRDPYLLDFLGLADTYSERDLETAILRELERFLLELGAGFAFIARQKRIIIDGEDYYIDLLFYHRGLRRLVALDLKIGKFQAADKGQMELYLRWLDRYERRPEEESPMGLILCAGTSAEHIELLQLGRSGIHVAEYLTELPPRAVLEERLKAAISVARKQLEMQYDIDAMESQKMGDE
jgi:predicted nuclease of restriction endonuclease-like (RecB) superfamily